MESLTRVILVEAGLPEPELNKNVRSRDGRFLGRVDMSYPEYRVAVEYDGDQHRTSQFQFDRDIDRLDCFAAEGWRFIRVRPRHLFQERSAFIQRVDRALRERGWVGSKDE